ncbi:ATP-dependent protease La [Neorickettsia helminthoeca str. Oregon]|uniref:Lon protease n=1 Tax=Neorickettsia helminthoeca str. Oregon TaxID=1286528 RepID=X5H3L5_9RICK|nr:endopeptidase La [Neorickettsia helminthoeca]AHX11288.1 ATP-dependent protease La [Neorickettsia helminthoeca str. Oregon]
MSKEELDSNDLRMDSDPDEDVNLEIDSKELLVPVLPLREVIFFPGDYLPIFVGRKASIKAMDKAIADSSDGAGKILLVAQKDPKKEIPEGKDLYKIGVIARIAEPKINLQDGGIKLMVIVESRAKVLSFKKNGGILEAQIVAVEEDKTTGLDIEAYRREIIQDFEKCVKLSETIPDEIIGLVSQIDSTSRVVDLITASISLKLSEKQEILETINLRERVKKVHVFLEKELGVLQIKQQIKEKTESQIKKSHKVYLLNEQLKTITKELYEKEGGEYDEITDLEKKVNNIKLSAEAKEKVLKELRKLKTMVPLSAEATVVRNYIDWIISLPWGKKGKMIADLSASETILKASHYGMEKVKERIIEYLAVQNRTKSLKGSILCLVGPPGVGKTSLAQAIAEATGRPFVRMSLGGIRDESEIKGHRRTYIGAMPGKIIQHMKKAKLSNPVFLLDEIDKMSMDFRSDPAFALLEVLDPEQNAHFVDHYLEVEYDLSNVMFVATANSLNMIPALLDRLEIIRLEAYSEEEKVEIASNYLIAKLRKEHGLKKGEWSISRDALKALIRQYTRESGVRSLKRELANLMRKAVKQLSIEKNVKSGINISTKNLKKYAGVSKYNFGTAETQNLVGMTTGLAYTQTGGDLITIEAVLLPGKGEIRSTGKLGEVMQESIQAAYSFVCSNCNKFGFTSKFFKSKDIHLHVPEGATSKDGPSAGVAICTSIVSVMTGIPVCSTVAMTGEVSLRGKVMEIGGLKEKLLAAVRGGIETVLIPKSNEKDLVDIPKSVKSAIKIIPVSTVSEAFTFTLSRQPVQISTDVWPDTNSDASIG